MKTSLKLYDALIQVKVPNAAAEALVEALETELTATLLTRNEFEVFRTGEFAGLRNEFASLRNEFGELRNEVGELRNDVSALRSEIAVLPHKLMLWLGGTVVASVIGTGLTLFKLLH